MRAGRVAILAGALLAFAGAGQHAASALLAFGAAGRHTAGARPAVRRRISSRRARGQASREHRYAPAAAVNRLIWSDEFDGPAGAAPDPSKWSAEVGGDGWGNEELEYYTARAGNVALNGHGQLAITARRESYTGADGVTREYTSARLQTKGLFATRYGRIEARIKLPLGRGLWPAFWALGSDIEGVGWPACGEIDVMESLGNEPFRLYGSIHGPEAGNPRDYSLTAAQRSPVSLASSYHIYAVEWSASAIVFSFDGVPYSTRTPASLSAGQQWVFDKPFFLLLNLAVGGTWPGPPESSTLLPATMLIDWVRVYD